MLDTKRKPYMSKILFHMLNDVSTQWACTAEHTTIMYFHFQPVFLFFSYYED